MIDLVAPFLTAVDSFSQEVIKQDLKHIEMENFHIYLIKYEKFTVVFFSDIEDDTVPRIVENLGEIIKSNLDNIDTEVVIENSEIIKEISRKAEELLVKNPPSINFIKSLTLSVSQAVDGIRDDTKLKIKDVKPSRSKFSLISRVKKVIRSPPSIEELLQLTYSGNFQKVIELTQGNIKDIENMDLIKSLYVNAGLILNTFDPKVKAPSLDEIYSTAIEINDDLFREILIAKINGFIKLGSYNDVREITIKNKQKIKELINEESIRSKVFQVIITPPYDTELLHILKNKFDGVSEYLYAFNYEMIEVLKIFFAKPKSIDSWLKQIAIAKNLYEKATNPIAKSIYGHLIFFYNFWGLLLPDLSESDGQHIIETLERFWTEEIFPTIKNAAPGDNRHKAVLVYFALGSIINIALSLHADKAKEIARKHRDEAVFSLEWILSIGKANRENLDMYFTSASSILAATARILWENGEISKDIPKLVYKFTEENIEKFWTLNAYHYAHIYIALLESLGYTLLRLPKDSGIRRSLMERIASGIEIAAQKFPDNQLMQYLIMPEAIKFYYASGSEYGRTKADEIIKQYEGKLSPFMTKYIESIKERFRD